jgi:hypothetical protein
MKVSIHPEALTEFEEAVTYYEDLQICEGTSVKSRKRGRARNAPKFDLRAQLFRMCGVDLKVRLGMTCSSRQRSLR